MFQGKTAGLLMAALLLASGATWLANRWLAKAVKTQTLAPEIVAIVVAKKEIPFGAKIDESLLQLIDWPKKNLPNDYFKEFKQVVGEISTQTIYPGDVINKARIRDHKGGSPLSALIETNMRAVSVRVNDVVGVSGFLLPGNRVDVLASKKPSGQDKSARTFTILEDVKVLAVDQESAPEKDKPVVVRSVTLEVKPAQAERLAQATVEGTIQLALRNPLDHTLTPPTKVESPVVEAEKPEPVRPVSSVMMLKGTRTQFFQCKDARCNVSAN